MSYATADDLKQRIGESVFQEIYGLSDGSDQSDQSDKVTDDLESAAAEIDGAIAFRYRLPVTGERSLALLKDWNLTLAEERAFARPVGGDYTEKIKRRVDQVRKYLDMIRADQFRLPDAPEKGAATSGSGIALVQQDKPVFGREEMSGF